MPLFVLLIILTKMTLEGCRNHVLFHVPTHTLQVGNNILHGARRASDVVTAIRAYLVANQISRPNWSTTTLAMAVCHDLRRAGVMLRFNNGFYESIGNRRTNYVFVLSSHPLRLTGLRSGLPWSFN